MGDDDGDDGYDDDEEQDNDDDDDGYSERHLRSVVYPGKAHKDYAANARCTF